VRWNKFGGAYSEMVGQVEDLAQIRSMNWSASQHAPQQVRIVVADDQRLFRESIAGILGMEAAFAVVGVASNGLEAVEAARQLHPHVLLMDVKMPQMDGIVATRCIRSEFPEMRVILLTTFATDDFLLESLEAGASGYLLKDMSAAGLVSAIRAVFNGEQVTAPDITNRMMQLLGRQLPEKRLCADGLTSRETETLKLIARGMIAKEIAHTLAISEKTVRNHISSIYRKLDMYDRSQMVIYAMKKGLVDIHEMR
jgi:DNA-binding NarL/FixJ family response regulator